MKFLIETPPQEAYECATCKRTRMIYHVMGQPNIEVWLDEMPKSDAHWDEFLDNKLAERYRKKMN